MADKFGIGIIGCGEISQQHGTAYQRLADRVKMVAVADPVEPAAHRRAEEFGIETVYTDYRDLLADKRVDIVAICTPHNLHAPMTIAAAEAGKHILVEKPMALNVGEMQEMIAAANRNGVKLTMPTERVNPRHRFVHEHVLPEIGAVQFSYLVDFYYRNMKYYEKARWRGVWAREGGGIFINQAIYTWDTFQWFQGGVDTAYGYWANLLHPNIEVEDIGYGLVRFRNGTHGKLFATSICEEPPGTRWMSIQGSAGEIFSTGGWLYEVDFSLYDKEKEKRLKAERDAYVAGLTGPGFDDPWDTRHIRRVLLTMRDLAAVLREGGELMVSAASCGEAIKILNGIHWCGWLHTDAFRQWAYSNFEMLAANGRLPTADDSGPQGWHGGKLIETLVGYVTDPKPSLDAPFTAV